MNALLYMYMNWSRSNLPLSPFDKFCSVRLVHALADGSTSRCIEDIFATFREIWILSNSVDRSATWCASSEGDELRAFLMRLWIVT